LSPQGIGWMAVKKKVVAKKSTAKKKVAVSKKKAVAKKAATPKTKAVAKKSSAPKKVATKKATTKQKTVAKKSSGASPKHVTKKPITKKPAIAKAKQTKANSPSQSTTSISLHGVSPYHEKRGEQYMNKQQAEHFRSILKNWKRELMEEVDRTVHHMQDEAANFPDPNDRASQESEFALELRTRDRERKLIKKIDESLVNLDNEDYGYCDVCGIEIGIRRLEARPTATQCIDCKTLDEIREKQSRV